MVYLIGRSRGVNYLYIDDLPLIGHVAFGVIDRGTNVIQVRPTTICQLNCVFCSVDAGPFTRYRQSEYIVDLKHLIKWIDKIRVLKNNEIDEALIDGVGDPTTYSKLPELVYELKKRFSRVAVETHGQLLSYKLINELEKAGLDRINLSIDTLDPAKARLLQGVQWYDVEKVKKFAEYIVNNTRIDIHLTPVWIPGINDKDIEEIIEWGLSIGVGRRFPPFGIQKYMIHKYGRKIRGVKEVSWDIFREFLEKLEKKYGAPLYYKNIDFGIRKTRSIPTKYEVGEKVFVKIVSPGWLKKEVLAVDSEEEVVITVIDVEDPGSLIGRRGRVKIIENSDNIYIATLT